jgi:hypothetical protein
MAESVELIAKLQIKAGSKLWLINVPEDVAEALTAGAEIEIVGPGAPCTGVIAFADNPTEATAFTEQALPVLPPDGLLWFAYPKGSAGKAAGISRDHGWDALEAADWRPVRSVSIDDEWTGLRFRPVENVKSAKPDAWRTRAQR